jgi:hypothetical protein
MTENKEIPHDPDRPTPWPLPEFLKLDIPPVEYFVKDILQKNGKAMISAAPNVGKSILVQNMALDIASGKSLFMEKFPVASGKVLYLDLEMGDSSLQERFQKMCDAKTISGDNLYLKYLPTLNLLEEPSRKLIEAWLEESKIQVLILDPLGNAWAGDESKQEQVGQLTAYLNTLIKKFGISILVVHHWRKATKDFKSGGQMAAGSYKWEAWLDTHVTLEGQSSSVTISCHKNRNRPKFPPFLVKLNVDNLCFEFVADFQKQFTADTLQSLFDSFNADRVAIPDLIERAKEQKVCSETTLRKLFKETKQFRTDASSKTHYLVKKDPENQGWDEAAQSE